MTENQLPQASNSHEAQTTDNQNEHKTVSNSDSLTAVYRGGNHGVGIWGGRRVVMSIRVDEKIKQEWTVFAQKTFGSTCKALETIMVAMMRADVKLQNDAVYRGSTVNVNFEHIRIERNLRARRNLPVQDCEIEELKEQKRRMEIDRELNELERHYSEVLELWARLKPSARTVHLRKARVDAEKVKAAQLLLERVSQGKEVSACP